MLLLGWWKEKGANLSHHSHQRSLERTRPLNVGAVQKYWVFATDRWHKPCAFNKILWRDVREDDFSFEITRLKKFWGRSLWKTGLEAGPGGVYFLEDAEHFLCWGCSFLSHQECHLNLGLGHPRPWECPGHCRIWICYSQINRAWWRNLSPCLEKWGKTPSPAHSFVFVQCGRNESLA